MVTPIPGPGSPTSVRFEIRLDVSPGGPENEQSGSSSYCMKSLDSLPMAARSARAPVFERGLCGTGESWRKRSGLGMTFVKEAAIRTQNRNAHNVLYDELTSYKLPSFLVDHPVLKFVLEMNLGGL